jgi:ectoine hydroxylase-related dioxygenase (phytanoyl-CoA dioxygenase family)
MDLEREYQQFWDKGYLVVRNVFSTEEMQVVKDVILNHAYMNEVSANLKQKIETGKRPSFESIFVWNDTARDDVFAKVTRRAAIFDRLEHFFRDRIYVYHNKITLKYPGVVGFRYHQDYAYWYDMGCLYPDMATVLIAVDPASRKNGCLKMLTGSHKLGRINHVFDDGVSDSGVNPERLALLEDRLEEEYVELASGDIVLFHANTLHGSDDNLSEDSRIALLGCYNTKHNNPYKSTNGHPYYQDQQKITDKITPQDADKLPDFDMNFS